MKKWILHIMLVGVLGMLAASCSQDVDSPLQTEGKKVKVTFTLATGGQDTYSRTTWKDYVGDGENDTSVYGGEAFDNKIDPDQLQVLICDNDCTPIAKVQRLLHTKEGNNVYKFTGSFVATINPTSYYKIMVFANCPEITLATDFSTVVSTMPGNTANLTAIPMWGVQQISGGDLLVGNSNLTIYVLRALAKVEITISASVFEEGYTLKSASFKKYNEKINCIPNGFKSVASTTVLATGTSGLTSEDNTIPASFNPNNSQLKEGLAFATVEEGKKLVAYVPEYENKDNLEMTVIVKKTDDKTEKSYDIPFKYSVTAVGDVIRNYYYTYNIIGIMNEELLITIAPWTTYNPSWEIEIDTQQ